MIRRVLGYDVIVLPKGYICNPNPDDPPWLKRGLQATIGCVPLIRHSPGRISNTAEEATWWEMQKYGLVYVCDPYISREGGYKICKIVRDAITHALVGHHILAVWYMQRLTRKSYPSFRSEVQKIRQDLGVSDLLYILPLIEGTRSQTTKAGMKYAREMRGIRPGPKISPQNDRLLFEMNQQGSSVRKIAIETGIPKSSVQQAIKRVVSRNGV